MCASTVGVFAVCVGVLLLVCIGVLARDLLWDKMLCRAVAALLLLIGLWWPTLVFPRVGDTGFTIVVMTNTPMKFPFHANFCLLEVCCTVSISACIFRASASHKTQGEKVGAMHFFVFWKV